MRCWSWWTPSSKIWHLFQNNLPLWALLNVQINNKNSVNKYQTISIYLMCEHIYLVKKWREYFDHSSSGDQVVISLKQTNQISTSITVKYNILLRDSFSFSISAATKKILIHLFIRSMKSSWTDSHSYIKDLPKTKTVTTETTLKTWALTFKWDDLIIFFRNSVSIYNGEIVVQSSQREAWKSMRTAWFHVDFNKGPSHRLCSFALLPSVPNHTKLDIWATESLLNHRKTLELSHIPWAVDWKTKHFEKPTTIFRSDGWMRVYF